LKGAWVEPDLRDEVVDYVREWSEKTEIPATRLVQGLGLGRSKYYDWRRRYGKVNEHNGWVPRDHWLEESEKESIIAYYLKHPGEGYRRLTYMMIDEDIVAASPSSVYRVLRGAGLLRRWNRAASKKGTGFQQPSKPHEHWHIDISYINIRGAFYYLCSVLDGFSRYLVNAEIRQSMTEADVEIVLQRARESFPGVRPRIISDNGPQFVSKDFKEFIRLSGMTHVRTSPFYPQSNGKQERWHATVKRYCIRPGAPLDVSDARRMVAGFKEIYNTQRLHSAIGYVTPLDKLEGRAEAILAERERKLQAARERRSALRKSAEKRLTSREMNTTIQVVGETESGNAGERPARDSRPGRRAAAMGARSARSLNPCDERANAPRLPMPDKTPGSGAEPQDIVTALTPDGPESLIGVRHLSNSR